MSRLRVVGLAVLAALVAAMVVVMVRPAEAAAPLRVMPLGDSITGGPGCWRAVLWDRLQRNGFTNVDFVGTLPGGGCNLASWDGDNEGHGGFTATGIANQNQLPGWLAATSPDIVLMHLGTNDVWGNPPTANILAAYSTLVDQMRANNPNMKILVAQIIPMAPPGCAYCPTGVTSLNSAIPAWAASRTTTQSPIIVVDQFTGFNAAADTSDGVHPVDSGFQKMSDRWYPALTPLLGGTTPTDTTPPTVPSGLAANVTCNPLTVRLSWTASTDNVGVTGYDVFRATNGNPATLVASSTTTSYTEPLVGSAQYQVRARDAAGNTSALTAPVNAVPPPCPMPDTVAPTTPGTPTATVTCGTATLTWAPSTDNVAVTGYDIFRAAGASGGTFASVGSTTTTSFTQTNSPGTFRYQIRARDGAGNLSPFTSPITVNIPACPNDTQPPTTPGTPVASGTTSSATTLTWTASTDNVGVTGYDIFRAPGGSGGTFASVGTSTTTTFTNTGLSAGTTYRYQVRARDAAGNTSAFSAAVTVTTSGTTGGCTATYRQVGSWQGGFQGEVTVANTGTTATTGWTVTLTFPNGQLITQIWSARTSSTASPYTITNETYNGALAPSASTTFGFLGSSGATNGAPTATCTRTP